MLQSLTRIWILVLAVTLAPALGAHAQSLTMAGGFAGGTFNDFVAGISTAATAGVEGLEVVVLESAGSAANLRALLAGELDMAVAFAGDTYLAFNGFENFGDDEQVRGDVRAVGFLYSAVSQIVTLADSGIETFDQLVGKRVAVGAVGSGTHLTMERLLRQAGMIDSVEMVFVSGTSASELLLSGAVDAYHVLLGVPNATVLATAADHDIRLLETLPVAIRSGLFDRYPFYTPIVVRGDVYRSLDVEVPVFKDAGLWVVRADLDEDLVYQMTRTVYGPAGIDAMMAVTPVAREMGPSTALRGVALPLHPGAARYWEEIGLQLPAVARP